MSRSSSIVSCGEQTNVLDPNIDIKFEPVFEREDEEERIDFDQIAYEASQLAPTCVLGYDQSQTNPVIDANSEIVVKIDPNHVLGMENEMHHLNRTKTKTVPPLRLHAAQKRTRDEADPEYTLSSRSESGRNNKKAKRSTKSTRKDKGGGRKTSAKKTSKLELTRRKANSTISNENSRIVVKNTTEAVEVEEINWEPLIVPKKLHPVFKCCVRMKRTSNSKIGKFIKTKVTPQAKNHQFIDDHRHTLHHITESVSISEDEFSDFNPGTATPDRLASDDDNDRFEEYRPSETHTEIGHPIPSTTEIKRSKSGQIMTCLECHKSFTRPAGLAYHMKVMHGNKPPDREFECGECGKSYHKKSQLDQHKRCHESKDSDGPWTQRKPGKTVQRAGSSQGRNFPKSQCEFCQRVFSRPSGLAYHQKQSPSSPPLACKVCPQTFKLANCLNYHIQENHPEVTTLIKIVSGVKRSDAGLFNCTECGKGFTRPSGLAYHMRVKHTNQPMERRFVCDECGKTFLQKGHLTEHRRTHSIDANSEPERAFACEHCDKTFIRRNHMLHHLRSHTGEKYPCRHCSVELTTTYQRAIHEKLEHGVVSAAVNRTYKPKNKNRRLNCTHMGCDKFFHTLQTLKIHERTHTGEKPYLCCECGAAYKSAHSLKEHTNSIHTGLRPYSCPDPTCEEKFARRLNLKYHVVMKHEALATKKFPCEFCSMKFFTRLMLIRHRRKHTGEKPYSCHMCTARFKQSFNLHSHLKRCGVVSSSAGGQDKTSPKSSVIKQSKPRKRQKIPKHLRPPPQKREKIHPCQYCPNKFFTRLSDARRHEKSIHTGENPFVCVKCRSRFRTKHRLNVHKKMHENGEDGDLTTVCPYCSKTFVKGGRLNNHIRLKHPGLGQAEVLETNDQYVPAHPIPTFPTASISSQHHSLSRLAESIGQLREESDSYYGMDY